ncbi:hypothetical protein, partial [Falsiroseomonas oryziterrae]|uniref:hypothetical protein n=1 Tax=Falsiroseomonas oryziterrae TaxID=2911368 RepID=UPI001F2EA509
MKPSPLLLALLLPIACAQPQDDDMALLLQEVMTSQQAAAAGLAAPPARSGSESGLTAAGQLVGQTPDTLRRLLGEPRLRREEGPAEVWHYQATQCHLDLVLYREDGGRQALRVAYASARASGAARRGEAACLRDIAR